MKKTILHRMTAVLIALMITLPLAVGANAISLTDFLFPSLVEVNEDINVSSLSADHIYLGESVKMYAKSKGLDESKCEYAFYRRISLLNWEELSPYSKKNVYRWTPVKKGEYEICIKIKYNGKKIYKRYFTLSVTEELINESLISSSFVKVGETVELSGIAKGGEGDLRYGFYYKDINYAEWNCLSAPGDADHIQWSPKVTGTYDICIKVYDERKDVKKKYFTLQVDHPSISTPAEFTLTVRAPISSPYLWSCTMSDEEVLTYTVREKGRIIDTLDPYVLLEYRFRTASIGNTVLRLHYCSADGQDQELTYDITVDKNLNYTLNDVSGTYWNEALPEPVQTVKTIQISLLSAPDGYLWKYHISDSLTAEAAETPASADPDTYSFRICRSGGTTLTFTCVSKTDMTERYRLIYDISVDEQLNLTILHADGNYFEDTPLPDILVL